MRWWDVAACHALEQRLFLADPWSEPLFWSELAGVPETRHYVVAVEGDEVVAYGGLMAVGGQADVQTIAVSPEHQGRGVGRQVLTQLLEEAARRGCTSVLLEVRVENTVAQRLYETAGFVQIARRTDYYGPGLDGVVMRRG